ncbi:MAG: class I SAM-dependent methyltransferase [Bacilli bacterium]|nr:class I SAM-dependent methyltransferase [Bacilli bacterium]MDD4056085.1 class I SAM-dependent methyltransferase [Bacilli bacterium]
MSHYYVNDDSLDSKERIIEYTFRGTKVSLYSDLGVFSKDRVDFGTNVLLNNLPDFPRGSRILDVGCGYGIIGIAIAKSCPDVKVDMVDINQRAVELVKKSIEHNKVSNVHVYESNLFAVVNQKYDFVITNPPIRAGKIIVHQIIEDSIMVLNEKGTLWAVIQKKQGAPSFIEKMEEVFGNAEKVCKENGYYVVFSRKN